MMIRAVFNISVLSVRLDTDNLADDTDIQYP